MVLRLRRWRKILDGSTFQHPVGVHASWCLETSVLHGFLGAKFPPKHTGYNYQMSLTGGEAAGCHLHAELSLAEPLLFGSSLAQGMGSWNLQMASSHFKTLLIHCQPTEGLAILGRLFSNCFPLFSSATGTGHVCVWFGKWPLPQFPAVRKQETCTISN